MRLIVFEVAAAVVTPADLAEGSVAPIEPEASLSVTPVAFNLGEVVMIDGQKAYPRSKSDIERALKKIYKAKSRMQGATEDQIIISHWLVD